MSALSLLLFCLFAAETPLDDFSPPAGGDGQTAWQPDRTTPPLKSGAGPDGCWLELRAPFAADAQPERVYIDRDVQLDLSRFRDFSLRLAVDQPRAVAHLSLYFRSGDGWLGCSAALPRAGWQTVHFPRAAFRSEGQPRGWEHVDGIRLAAWRGADLDAVLQLDQLRARVHQIALVVADQGQGGDGELRAARDTADRVADLLQAAGLPHDRVEQSELEGTAEPLAAHRIAILPYNPQLGERVVDQLVQFAERGGQLLACYALPPRLGAALGIEPRRHVRQDPEGQFAQMRFAAADVAGLPAAVQQASWNIQTAEPAGHNARIIGQWYDAEGRSSGHPALLLSDRGAYLTHILLGDDRAGKEQLLAALLGHMLPSLWEAMAAAAEDRAQRIGHCESLEQLQQFVSETPRSAAGKYLRTGLDLRLRAGQLRVEQEYPAAVNAYRDSHQALVQAYLQAQPSRPAQVRAVWNHSGTGAWPGDWERSAQLLADNGFRLVLPNLLWGGRAHYPSDILPRSSTYERYGDQVQQCVEAAHRHGLEVHVWKVNYNLSGAPAEFVARLRGQGRTQVSVRGEPHDWLCPSHPENQQLERDSLLEVVRRYPIDGLHFDYIRYPDGEHCYCDGCRDRFTADAGTAVANWPADCYRGPLQERYRQWRCAQITALVQAVHREAKRLRPGLKISAAVFGSYPSCRDSVGQDWPKWVEAGLLDFVCPMDYTESQEAFCGLVQKQLQLVAGRIPVYPGIGASASNSTLAADAVVAQIHHAGELGAAGFTIFDFNRALAESIIPAVGLAAVQAEEP